MNPEAPLERLTEEQRQLICKIVAVGCDRDTAAKYARTTWPALQIEMNLDRTFAADVRYEEAAVELYHMTKIHEAAALPANWRTSVWWLEALAPERYGPRGTSQVSSRQLKLYLEHVATTLVVEVHNDDDRTRLLAKLHHTAMMLEIFLRDESIPEQPASGTAIAKTDIVDQ